MGGIRAIELTGDPLVDGILWDSAWDGVVTFGFPDSADDFPDGYGEGEPDQGFFAISQVQQAVVRYVLGQVEALTNLEFSYAGAQTADLSFAQSSLPPTAYADSPAGGGDVWFGSTNDYRSPRVGDYAYQTHFHEIGHALGLKHPHDVEASNGTTLPSQYDWLGFSVMSYRSYAGADTGYGNETFGYPTTFMPLDILALQTLYGANYTTNSSNTVYTWNPLTGQHSVNGALQPAPGSGTGVVGDASTNRIFMAIWDGGGTDTYDLSNYTTGLRISLEPGGNSTLSGTQVPNLGDGHYGANVYNAYLFDGDRRSLIENAIGGSGNDNITGNLGANRLRGEDGNDTLLGMGGSDVLIGGAGNDMLAGGAGTDSLLGGIGDNVLIGGYAIDTVTIDRTFRDSLIYAGRNGHMKIGGVEGLDTVLVETVKFDDRTIALEDFTPSDAFGPKLTPTSDNIVFVWEFNQPQTLKFDEEVEAGSGFLHIRYADGQIYRSYLAEDLLAPGIGLSNIFQFELPTDPGNYYVEIDADFVVDRSGNAFAGLSGADSWNFKVGGVDDYPDLPAARSHQDKAFIWADSSLQYTYPTINMTNQSSITITGYLDTGEEEDWHRLTLDSSKTYLITYNTSGPNGADGSNLRIVTWKLVPGFNFYDFYPLAGTENQVVFQPPTYGNGSSFFIGNSGAPGEYSFTISVWEGGDDFVNDNNSGGAAATGSVTLGTPLDGVLAAGGNTIRWDESLDNPGNRWQVSGPDTDWMKVDLVAGQTYSFHIRAGSSAHPDIDSHGPFQLMLLRNYVTDSQYEGTTYPYLAGSQSSFNFTATETATYWLQVQGGLGGYTILVDEGPTTSDWTGPTLISAITSVSNGPATIILTFNEEVRPGSGSFGLTMPEGSLVIDSNDESQVTWSGSTVVIRPAVDRIAAGVSTLAIAAGSVTDLAGNRILAGSTSFTVANGAAGDDFSANLSTTGVIEVGDSVLARIGTTSSSTDPGDWFRTTLQAGIAYDLRAIAEPYGQLKVQLRLRDANGQILDEDLVQSGGGGNAHLVFTPSSTGTYVLEVVGANQNSGLYLIEVMPLLTGLDRSGSAAGDRMTGTAVADTLRGGEGADEIDGRGGDDTLQGGDGDDVLSGGTGIDRLEGGAGNDRLAGGKGADNLAGGADDDTYLVDDSLDVVVEASSRGTDTVRSQVDYSLPANVENLVLVGAGTVGIGNGLANRITGNSAANRLDGGAGDDLLDGGAGADRMLGGAGDDSYWVDRADDVVTEAASAGTDTVYTGMSYTLGANLERLVLTGTATIDGVGNDLANDLIGNAASNRLDGGGGNDTLDGGAGPDAMFGGAGNDTYRVDEPGDEVVEAPSAGSDRVISSISYILGDNLEILTLAGPAAIDGTGNTLANLLEGNAAANRLDGGAAADIMRGGDGDDTYVVDVAGDQAIEDSAGGGVDTVSSAVSYTLGDHLEHLVLTGTAAIDGTGNGLANTMTGNGGVNRLSGGDGDDQLDGKAGADVMSGGLGNDIYIVDNIADTTVEASAVGGTDVVRSSVTFALAANVEDLLLLGTQAIDGAGNELVNNLTGNGAANRLDGKGGADTMSGGLGNDIYVVDDAGDRAIETKPAGGVDTVLSAVSFTLGSNLENLTLTGTGAINGAGNGLANSLTGNGAANRLDGKAGADTMSGGLGNDVYVVDDAGDRAVEASAAGGIDVVLSAVSFTLGSNLENLTLTGTGAINGAGNVLANSLVGNDAANRLDGKAGADTMSGGLGNDAYVVDDAGDRAIETKPAGGIDTVLSGLSFTLGSNLENLTLTGTGAINGGGNGLANSLVGNDAANRLDGKVGADTMSGGLGDDTYVVDDAGDRAIETKPAGGIDTVLSAVSLTLGSNLENLTLTGTGATNAGGNGLANNLTGNDAANRLDGKAGADTMSGGLGNDVYVIDDAGDKAIETKPAGGVDTVLSAVSFTLGSNLENLTLTGADAINATGNGLANSLTGNDAANRLDGKAGADMMSGGLGNDVYVVDDAGDRVIETKPAGGVDTVLSAVSFTLGGNLENLTLTGAAEIEGGGNGLNNVLSGNGAANILKGGLGTDQLLGGSGNDRLYGGLGGDQLTGGSGNDDFLFDTALGAGNVDVILDFSRATDTIHLDRDVFTQVAMGILSAAAFRSGSIAADADDRIIYDAATGNIYYDSDGNGAAAAILFAQVHAGTVLDHTDFNGFG